jgi:AcrR family transcriptional regulator
MENTRMQTAINVPPARRARDPQLTRQTILEAAFVEFSDNGLSGARVDAIAARTNTNVRMIYYYFGSKDGLYRAVLERSYAAMREAEKDLHLDRLDPPAAIRHLTEFVFDYHEANPRFSRLVSIENIHNAAHIAQSDTIQTLNETVITTIAGVLARGQEAGLFRRDCEPIGVHLLITAFCYFRVSNRHSLGTIFRQDPLAANLRAGHRRMIVDSVLGYLQHASTTA